jgi:hypothetical protein
MTARAPIVVASIAMALCLAAAPAAAQNTGSQPPAPPASAAATAETPAGAAGRLPLRLALQTEGAVGVYPGDFYNHLLGVRLDLVFSPHVSFGGYLGYANLKGKDGRAHDLLPYVQVEYMAGPLGGIRIPLRFASGYLPRNGPIARLSTGFAFALTPALDLVTELLAPMIWVTGDQMVLSMNLAAELVYRF